MQPTPFSVRVEETDLDDLAERLRRARVPEALPGDGWERGTAIGFMRALVDYWRDEYDWRAQESRINSFDNYVVPIEGVSIHFVHERGSGPNPFPLVISHGWPGSFVEMLELVPRLAHPERYGGDPGDSFDVVVPSLPGFGFSGALDDLSRWYRTSDMWATLMTEALGYAHFGAHGGDIGAGITAALGMRYPERVAGIHMTTDWPVVDGTEILSDQEQRVSDAWERDESAYGDIQGTKPQTLGLALNDSPVGLAAWIIEKWRAWSDCGGDVLNSFTKDQLLTNVMIYWISKSITTSFVPYFQYRHTDKPRRWHRIEVPTGISIPPGDAPWPHPRAAAEATYDLVSWSEMPRGGHFSALEAPDLLAEEIRVFFRPLRAEKT
jgi:pimeloyl-ACP methyl ester carboxylesterase